MRKLKDKGFRIWFSTIILIGILFFFPAEVIVAWVGIEEISVFFVRAVTVLLSLVLAFIAFSRYNSHAMKTANDAAEYTSVDECVEDIANDVATHQMLLSISWIYLALGVGAMIMGAIISQVMGVGIWPAIKSYVSIDWVICYLVLLLFNFKMTSLRGKERDLTIKNSLLSMERKPLVMGTTGT